MGSKRRKTLICQRNMHVQISGLVFIELHNNKMEMSQLADILKIDELKLLNKLLGLADMDMELLAEIFSVFGKVIRIGANVISFESRGK